MKKTGGGDFLLCFCRSKLGEGDKMRFKISVSKSISVFSWLKWEDAYWSIGTDILTLPEKGRGVPEAPAVIKKSKTPSFFITYQ